MATAELRQTTLRVSSPYGWRKLSGRDNLHKGTDFPFGSLTPVSAFGAGKVIFAGRRAPGHPDYERGLHAIIESAAGIAVSYHSASRLMVKTGETVRMGQTVCYGGHTAVGATGDHCHVGLWLNGVHVDLERYLTPGVVVTVSNTGSISSGGSKPIDNSVPSTPAPTKKRKKDMHLLWDTNGTGYCATDHGMVFVENVDHFAVLRRYVAGEDTFNLVQVGWIQTYIARCKAVGDKIIRDDLGYLNETGPWSQKLILAAITAKEAPNVDEAAIAKAVSNAVVAQIKVQGVDVDVDAIAAAVDAALVDNFAAIPDAVANENRDRMEA